MLFNSRETLQSWLVLNMFWIFTGLMSLGNSKLLKWHCSVYKELSISASNQLSNMLARLQMKGGAIAWRLLKFHNNHFTYINIVFLMWTHKATGAKVWDHSLVPSCLPALLYRHLLDIEFQVRLTAGESGKDIYLVPSSSYTKLNLSTNILIVHTPFLII